MRNPVERLTKQRGFRWISSGWVLIAFVILARVASPPSTLPGTFIAPVGFALEMTGTADGALGILRALDDEGHLAAAQRAIDWNFLFIFGYSVGLALLLNWVARYRAKMTPGLIAYGVWGALLAGGCAVVENVTMLILIGRYPDHAYFGLIALLGTLFSLAKWTLLCASAGYTAVQIIVTADNWTARAQESLNAIVAWLGKRFRRRGPAEEPAVEPGGI